MVLLLKPFGNNKSVVNVLEFNGEAYLVGGALVNVGKEQMTGANVSQIDVNRRPSKF